MLTTILSKLFLIFKKNYTMKDIQKLVGQGKTDEAINLLKKLNPNYTDIIQIESRWNRLKKQRDLGQISFENARLEENLIISYILDPTQNKGNNMEDNEIKLLKYLQSFNEIFINIKKDLKEKSFTQESYLFFLKYYLNNLGKIFEIPNYFLSLLDEYKLNYLSPNDQALEKEMILFELLKQEDTLRNRLDKMIQDAQNAVQLSDINNFIQNPNNKNWPIAKEKLNSLYKKLKDPSDGIISTWNYLIYVLDDSSDIEMAFQMKPNSQTYNIFISFFNCLKNNK